MVDMGIEPFLISSSVLLVCAQRLMRKICPHCKEPFQVPADVVHRLGLKPEEIDGQQFFRGRGCSRCKEPGYLGRVAILEILSVTETLREQILVDSSAKVIRDLALREGMRTLTKAGFAKVKAGLTSLDEVLRVTGDGH
jgi:type IV pilus assembly protein PilB